MRGYPNHGLSATISHKVESIYMAVAISCHWWLQRNFVTFFQRMKKSHHTHEGNQGNCEFSWQDAKISCCLSLKIFKPTRAADSYGMVYHQCYRFVPTFSETFRRHRWYQDGSKYWWFTRVWWLWFRAKSTTLTMNSHHPWGLELAARPSILMLDEPTSGSHWEDFFQEFLWKSQDFTW